MSFYATKNNDQELLNLVAKKNMTKIIEYLASKSDTIDREVDDNKKKNYQDILCALLLKRLRIDIDRSDMLLKHAMDNLTPYYDRWSGRNIKLTKRAFYELGSDFENIICIFFGLKESVSNNTIMWMLNQMGISVEEFKNMPYDDEDANERLNTVRESFTHIYKKLLKN